MFPKPFDLLVWFYYAFRGHTQVETAKILGYSRDSVAVSIGQMKKDFPEILQIRDVVRDPTPRPTQFFESAHSQTE